jgi:hypothetical protein
MHVEYLLKFKIYAAILLCCSFIYASGNDAFNRSDRPRKAK